MVASTITSLANSPLSSLLQPTRQDTSNNNSLLNPPSHNGKIQGTTPHFISKLAAQLLIAPLFQHDSRIKWKIYFDGIPKQKCSFKFIKSSPFFMGSNGDDDPNDDD